MVRQGCSQPSLYDSVCRAIRWRSSRTSSPRTSRSAAVTSDLTIFLRHTSSKSVLSIGFAMSYAASAAAAIDVGRERLTGEERAGLGRQERTRCDGAERDARLNDSVAVEAHRDRGRRDGEVERAAPPQLPVRAAPARLIRDRDVGEDLVRPARQIVHAVVLVEIGDVHVALARRRDEPHARAERDCSIGAVSVDDTARHRGLDVATQHVLPSFFMQKSIALRHSRLWS